MGSMKVHQLARGLCWDQHEVVPSLTLGCKRLRPLAPKQIPTTPPPPNFDLKSFIRPDTGPRKLLVPHSDDTTTTTKKDINLPTPSPQSPQQVETHPGGTRWNPTQEQIGILEMLYRGGMRTPNAQQIEQITGQLSKYGKIEGKNVFYWFQNHKARERQKQKRNSTTTPTLTLTMSHTAPATPRTVVPPTTTAPTLEEVERDEEEDSPYKKRCSNRWAFEYLLEHTTMPPSILYCREDQQQHTTTTTLELFPLHPEGR